MKAVILAAGMGRRLRELTKNNTKGMVEVNGVTLMERMLKQIKNKGINDVVVVIGYEGEKLSKYIDSLNLDLNFEYVENPIYNTTNNIYSLYLAREYLLEDDIVLFESDLIFEDKVLDVIIDNPYPSLALVAKYESWMDGTVVTLDDEDNIKRFIGKKKFEYDEMNSYYKTVNIYKFSKEFSQSHYVPFLEAYCKALGHNEYYEQVLSVITNLDRPNIKAVRLGNELWYEIDDKQDLDISESIFSSREGRVEKIQKRYGGYWRYPGMIDFCYLVNPYYPNQKLKDELKSNFDPLLTQYPSSIRINNLLVGKYFGVNEDYICTGNGATELIKILMEEHTEKLGIIYPSFEEYSNRKNEKDIVPFYSQEQGFKYTADDVIRHYSKDENSVDGLLVINPDNPSGNFIDENGLLKLIEWSNKENIRLIIDESFVDFSEDAVSLLDEELLSKYKNLIVIRSISKSFGVPGLRLGFMASGDFDLVGKLNKEISIWNINSFGEFFLQIFEKYSSEYDNAAKTFIETRIQMEKGLSTIKGISYQPTQANYFMIKLPEGTSAKTLTERLLNEHNILIKDLTGKKGIEGDGFVRIAVRDEKDNEALISAMSDILK